MQQPDAFYLPTGMDTFESTSATASPWDLRMQHGGPPAALLARAIERVRPDETMAIARITVEMLGSIPQGQIRTEASVLRPGRRVEMIEARLFANDTLAVTAQAWRIRQDTGATADMAGTQPDLPAIPEAPTQTRFFAGVPEDWGYGRAIDWRFVTGGYDANGPAEVWTRVRIPLVAGERTGAVSQMLIVADSTNGVSGELPMAEWLFIPPTVNLTVQRPAASEWMLLDARSTIGPNGVGLAQAQMYDEQGFIGVVAQPLLVARR